MWCALVPHFCQLFPGDVHMPSSPWQEILQQLALASRVDRAVVRDFGASVLSEDGEVDGTQLGP